MKHILSLDITETNNISVLRIADTSQYADFPATCGVLQIKVPGFNHTQDIDILPNFNLVLNACTLGIQTTGCNEHLAYLPDGIYQIKYSVSPNDQVYVEYAHLRTTATMNKYYGLLCDIELAACEPDAEVKDQLQKLRLVRSYVEAAKAQVEYCHDLEKGIELLKYAQSQLNKYAADGCMNC